MLFWSFFNLFEVLKGKSSNRKINSSAQPQVFICPLASFLYQVPFCLGSCVRIWPRFQLLRFSFLFPQTLLGLLLSPVNVVHLWNTCQAFDKMLPPVRFVTIVSSARDCWITGYSEMHTPKELYCRAESIKLTFTLTFSVVYFPKKYTLWYTPMGKEISRFSRSSIAG